MAKKQKLCGKCKQEPAVEGQRWGLECRAKAQGDYRRRKKEEFLALVRERARLVAGQIERMNGAQQERGSQ